MFKRSIIIVKAIAYQLIAICPSLGANWYHYLVYYLVD